MSQPMKYYSLGNNPFSVAEENRIELDKIKYPDHGRREFLHTLFWDLPERKGQIFYARLQDGVFSQRSTCDLADIEALDDLAEVSTYISLNVFNGRKREASQMRFLTSMYVDIDIHDVEDQELQKKKTTAQRVLIGKLQAGVLPVPTMITDTGRGYGLYYVLSGTIANTENAEKIRGYYNAIYDALIKRFQQELPGLVDPSVKDAARICRLPGTTNPASGTICRLMYCEPEQKWSLRDLSKYVTLEEYKKKKIIDISKRRIAAAEERGVGFCVQRIQSLRRLQSLRGENCLGVREHMLFILYSSLVRVYDHDEAVDKLYLFNSNFSQSLPEKELEHIIEETDNNYGEDGHEGYYKLSNKYIVDTLQITEEEEGIISLGCGRRAAARAEKRHEKELRITEIIEELKAGTPYREIAAAFDVSESTVKRLAKKHDLMRYKSGESVKNATRSLLLGVECFSAESWYDRYRGLGWYGESVAALLSELDTVSRTWVDRDDLMQCVSEYLDAPDHVAQYKDDQWMESGVLAADKDWLETLLKTEKKAHQKPKKQRKTCDMEEFQPDFRFSGITKKKHPDIDQGMVRALHVFFARQKQMKSFHGHDAAFVHTCFDQMTHNDILDLLVDLTKRKIEYYFAYTIAWVTDRCGRKAGRIIENRAVKLETGSEALVEVREKELEEQLQDLYEEYLRDEEYERFGWRYAAPDPNYDPYYRDD